MLYFIIALLDKWVSLIDGGSLTGLTSSDPNSRMPVGFGLAYCESSFLYYSIFLFTDFKRSRWRSFTRL